MTITNASPASAAFGGRLRFVLRFNISRHTQDRDRPVTSLMSQPATGNKIT